MAHIHDTRIAGRVVYPACIRAIRDWSSPATLRVQFRDADCSNRISTNLLVQRVRKKVRNLPLPHPSPRRVVGETPAISEGSSESLPRARGGFEPKIPPNTTPQFSNQLHLHGFS